jgi:N,N-dimethylformamidase
MPTTRREFIKRTGLAVAATSAVSPPISAVGARSSEIPPHRALYLEGVHAYASSESVPAGGRISFHVSSTAPWQLSICCLGLKVDNPAADEVLHKFAVAKPASQPIHPGSYIHVQRGLTGRYHQLSIECWIRLWKIASPAAVLAQFDKDKPAGFALFVNPDRSVVLYVGDGSRLKYLAFANCTLAHQRWHHVVVTCDTGSANIWVDGQMRDTKPTFPSSIQMDRAPLRVAAAGSEGKADYFLDADLAMPAIYGHALSRDEILTRFEGQGLTAPFGKTLLACWPLTEEGDDRAHDISSHTRHGTIVNHAMRMIGGPSFDAKVARFGSYDPATDPKRGHALRFASDDLYDCRWTATNTYRVPASAKSGIYVGRVEYELNGKPQVYHVTFVVKRSVRRKRAPLLVLCASNTWRAYSGTPFAASDPKLKQVWGTGGATNSVGDPPAYNFYRAHAAGQGTFQVGLRMPWPAAGPYILYGGPTDYSHLMRADRFAHVWLETSGYDFDVITDLDLHRDPAQLRGYKAFIMNGHSEYWSIQMYEGLRHYLESGGNVVCLSGNSIFWRVSYNEEGTVIECRKVDAPGEQLPHERRGECWHGHDGLRGGLMRECGYPGWKLIGLETLGWNNQNDPEQFGPYIVHQPEHFLFHRPEKAGIKAGDAIGLGPDGGLPRANGHEIDVRLSSLAALQDKPTPQGATLPSDPQGITRLANGIITWKKGGAAFDYFFRPVKPKTDQGGEMIYWERADGGRVFNTGSIGTGWALLADTKLQTLLRNVLHHFGVPANSARRSG